ncbi:MAG: ADP-forming succinate--CoA ligase subunit beta [Myxococcaceae bacterium]
MKIHEYQAKELLRQYQVPTLQGILCSSPDQIAQAADTLGYPCVLKAQIHAGGRGKGGGVKLAKTKEEALKLGEAILGMQLVTPQTGPEGQKVHKLLVEQGCNIAKEYYAGLVLDRARSQICFMASTEGGMEIEEVAKHHPEKILKEWADPAVGFMPYQARNLAYGLGLEDSAAKKLVPVLLGLYQAYINSDAALLEINPLVLTQQNTWVALDAKIDFDDNALFRQKHVVEMQDETQEDPRELAAQHHGLSYIALDGNIGCMVNGAGLAMATMDIIKHVGGEPANFLDVGGGATQQKVTEALKIILQDKAVKAVLINVFAGIAKCDVIASGVVEAVKELGLHVPLVVRLEGTHVNEGKEILKKSGLAIIPADDLLDGAKKAVAASRSV